jgi:hypothetical protein
MTQIRQGDVFLETVGEMPKGTRLSFEAQPGRLVLAYGEATGHHHSVAERDAEMIETEAGEIFLRIMRETPLEHQEHAAILLQPGIYRVGRQVEYVPRALPRRVAD